MFLRSEAHITAYWKYFLHQCFTHIMQFKSSHLPDAIQLFPCMQRKEELLAMYFLDFSLLSVNHLGTMLIISPWQQHQRFNPELLLKNPECLSKTTSSILLLYFFPPGRQMWQCRPILLVLTFLRCFSTDQERRHFPKIRVFNQEQKSWIWQIS